MPPSAKAVKRSHKIKVKTPIGTHDLLPPDSARWTSLTELFARTAQRYGFGLLSTPVFEQAAVFDQVGGGTDVVGKEMYQFADRSDRQMALRPEGTAAVSRAFSQHRPTTPWKVWYQGPFFRYEAPQAGRYRQFHQFGAETLGTGDPDADVEIIALAAEILKQVGLRQVRLVVNSLGTLETRFRYVDALRTYLSKRRDHLHKADQKKAVTHPLRLLDSKYPETIEATREAPPIEEFLDPAAAWHFKRVQAGLDALDVAYEKEPRLVRGLDYYTHTTFEFQSDAIDAAQDTICGGGRYDSLVEALGGPPTPGIGFALGIERLLLACDAEGVFVKPPPVPDVWVIDVTDGSNARYLTQWLREANYNADRSFDGRSMLAQIRSADRAGAHVAVIIGSDEIETGTYSLRRLLELPPKAISERVSEAWRSRLHEDRWLSELFEKFNTSEPQVSVPPERFEEFLRLILRKRPLMQYKNRLLPPSEPHVSIRAVRDRLRQ